MKYAEEGVQYHLNIKKGDVGRYVLLPGDPKRCKKIASYFENAKLVADHREYVTYTGTLLGNKISVTSTGIGGPSAAIAIEELVKAGADTFIRVGTSGGMQTEVKSGDLVIASAAIREEGTSRACAPIEFPAVAHLDVVNALVGGASRLEETYHTGVVHCKDNFYMQHESDRMPNGYEYEARWRSYLMLGTLASEMESAALYVFGSHLKVRVATVLLVVANQERERLGLENPVVHNMDKAIHCAIEAMKILMEKDQ